MRHHTAAALLAAAGIALAGCSSSSHSDPKPTATAPTTTAAAVASSSSTAVKLSTTWAPKLDAIANSDGMHACSTDSGSGDCVSAIGDAVSVYGSIASAITDANAQDEYPKTVAEVTKLVNAADTYDKDECAGDPNADVNGSPCPKQAIDVMAGASTLPFVMQTDELNAGVK